MKTPSKLYEHKKNRQEYHPDGSLPLGACAFIGVMVMRYIKRDV